MPDKTNLENKSVASDSGTLYMVLHGELAIFDGTSNGKPSDYICVYAPDLIEHVYMAGPWMGEQRIPRGTTLELTGVLGGADTIANYKDRYLVFQGGRCNPASSYMEIRLPRPRRIWPANLTALVSGLVTVTTPGVSIAPPKGMNYSPNIAMCCVFEYAIDGQAWPRLNCIAGPPMDTSPAWGAGKRANNSYSLHLFAEGDAIENVLHTQRSFSLAAQILGATATLASYDKKPGPTLTVPSDLLGDETSMTLAARIQRMGPTAPTPIGKINKVNNEYEFHNEYVCGHIAMLG